MPKQPPDSVQNPVFILMNTSNNLNAKAQRGSLCLPRIHGIVKPHVKPGPCATTARAKGYAFLLAAVLCWSSYPILTKVAYGMGFSVLWLAFLRFGLASLVLVPMCLVWQQLWGGGLRHLRAHPRLLNAIWRQGVAFAAAAYTSFCAVQMLQASLAVILLYLAPTFTSLLAVVIFRERLSRFRVLSLVLTFTGLIGVTGWRDSGSLPIAGVLVALLSALCSAAYFLLGQKNTAVLHPVVLSTGMVVVSLLVPVMALRTWAPSARPLTPAMAALAVAVAFFPTVLGPILDLLGIRILGAPRGSLVTTLEPPIALVLANVVLGEHLQPIQLLGSALVIAGVFTLAWEDYASREPDTQPPPGD